MNEVVTLVHEPRSRRAAMIVGRAAARLLGCTPRWVAVAASASVDEVAAVARETLSAPRVDALVVAGTAEGAASWRIATEAEKPVFVVPTGSRLPGEQFHRVLLPLDGEPSAAEAVVAVARRMDPGTTFLATHVFDNGTVPAFWDQAAHAGATWAEEFLARNIPFSADLRLRRGEPAAEVVAQADECQADLLVLGWSRRLTGSRARIVRRALGGRVPVLLVGATPPDPAEPR